MNVYILLTMWPTQLLPLTGTCLDITVCILAGFILNYNLSFIVHDENGARRECVTVHKKQHQSSLHVFLTMFRELAWRTTPITTVCFSSKIYAKSFFFMKCNSFSKTDLKQKQWRSVARIQR